MVGSYDGSHVALRELEVFHLGNIDLAMMDLFEYIGQERGREALYKKRNVVVVMIIIVVIKMILNYI